MTPRELRGKAIYELLRDGRDTIGSVGLQLHLSRQRVSQIANEYRKANGLPHWNQDADGKRRRRRGRPVVDIDLLLSSLPPEPDTDENAPP